MTAVFMKAYQILKTTPAVRVVLQLIVSLALIILVVKLTWDRNVLGSFRNIRPSAVTYAAGCLFLGYLLNSFRWQLLLSRAKINEPLGRLLSLYFISLFFSLFLPTSVGGDAMRAYAVGRRSQLTSRALLATLQERLLGLGGFFLIGLVATLYYIPLLPFHVRIWATLIPIVGLVSITMICRLRVPATATRLIQRAQAHSSILQRVAGHPKLAHIASQLRAFSELPPVTPFQLLIVLSTALVPALLAIGVFYVLGLSLNINVSFLALCMVVPLVGIVRMLPISLNGLGVGEGAFVFLMGFFAVPGGEALALALAALVLQTIFALVGGLLLALRIASGTWVRIRRPVSA